ncbi:MAG: T9SS type A sorting domain-containing protein [Cytophagales bacterium]|nr:T9SS type A sorting domain-containing protein [Cytophagales bacterium]
MNNYKPKRLFYLSLFLIISVGYSFTVTAQSDIFVPFDETQLSGSQLNLLNPIQQNPTTSRHRCAEINFGLLNQDTITLNLFSDVNIVAIKDRKEIRSDNDFTWFGTIQDTTGSIILVVQGSDITGTVRVNTDLYRITPLGNGVQAIIQVDQNFFPENHPPEFEIIQNQINPIIPPSQASIDDCQIRLLVAYTASVAAAVGNIFSLIQLAVDETNQSFVNSGVTHRVRLVRSYQVSYTETGLSTDLTRFRTPSDGFMDEIHTLRDIYSADICVLIENEPTYCGIASAILANTSTAFCIVHYTCATGYYSFGHEIGHLHGCRHNTEIDANTTPYAYGHGYCYPTDSWRTIMSYGCPGTTSRIQYWSNPGVTYGGVAMGTTSTQDNARVLDETSVTVSEFITTPTNLTISNETVSADMIAHASATNTLTIETNNIIENGASVTYRAGQEIIITDLIVEGELYAFIGTCADDPILRVAGSNNEIENLSNNNNEFIIKNDPEKFLENNLLINYPNPFNTNTIIEYLIKNSGLIKLSIFNIFGKEVATIIDKDYQQRGRYKVDFDATNLPNGIYYYTLKTSNNLLSKTMIKLN